MSASGLHDSVRRSQCAMAGISGLRVESAADHNRKAHYFSRTVSGFIPVT
jgi:hypothetical protein